MVDAISNAPDSEPSFFDSVLSLIMIGHFLSKSEILRINK